MTTRNWTLGAEVVKLMIFVIIAAVVGTIVITALRSPVDGEKISYSAKFVDVSGLHSGDDVRMAGVPVGKVSGIELDGDRAIVSFTALSSVTLRKSTTVAVYYKNLTGQRYLALVPGDNQSPTLTPGTRIAPEQTIASFDVTKLFNGFRPLLSTLDPASINQFADNLLHLVQDDGSGLRSALDSMVQITNHLISRDTLVKTLIEGLGTLSDELAGKSPQVVALLVQAQATLQHLTSDMTGILNAVSWANRALVPGLNLLEGLQFVWDDDLDPMIQLLLRQVPFLPTASDVLTVIPEILSAIRSGTALTGSGKLALCSNPGPAPIHMELCE